MIQPSCQSLPAAMSATGRYPPFVDAATVRCHKGNDYLPADPYGHDYPDAWSPRLMPTAALISRRGFKDAGELVVVKEGFGGSQIGRMVRGLFSRWARSREVYNQRCPVPYP